jgi:hypothetical protein
VTRDVTLASINVVSAAAWPSTIAADVVPGLTLFIDFVYFIHPTAIGHWLEHLLPTVSVLREESARPDRIVILHLKRTHVGEWVRTALAATLNIPPGSPLPPIYFQEETPSMFRQIGQDLEGGAPGRWTAFERALFVKDHNSNGKRVALTPEDAAAFADRAFRLHGLRPPRPAPWAQWLRRSSTSLPPPPRAITLFRKSSNRRIVNEDALVAMLQEFGAPVTVLEFTDATPMAAQLAAMANTGLLVSAHTSALANAAFLPPGAAIVELIHLNWVWLDQSFKVQSQARGDLHHWAWRATEPEHAQYIHPRDEQRFGGQEWAGDNVRMRESGAFDHCFDDSDRCFCLIFDAVRYGGVRGGAHESGCGGGRRSGAGAAAGAAAGGVGGNGGAGGGAALAAGTLTQRRGDRIRPRVRRRMIRTVKFV